MLFSSASAGLDIDHNSRASYLYRSLCAKNSLDIEGTIDIFYRLLSKAAGMPFCFLRCGSRTLHKNLLHCWTKRLQETTMSVGLRLSHTLSGICGRRRSMAFAPCFEVRISIVGLGASLSDRLPPATKLTCFLLRQITSQHETFPRPKEVAYKVSSAPEAALRNQSFIERPTHRFRTPDTNPNTFPPPCAVDVSRILIAAIKTSKQIACAKCR